MNPLHNGPLRLVPLLLLFFSPAACTTMFYQPDSVMYYEPERFGYEPREIRFSAQDGTSLFGWFFAARGSEPAKGTIVQFHGNAENLSSHYTSLVWSIDHGYNLFAFDYRGYGLSGGKPSPEGVGLDAEAALDQAYALHDAGVFVVVGQSLGGAVAMNAIGKYPHRNRIDLVVLDSTFWSYKEMAKKFLARHWLTWPFSFLAPLLVSDSHSPEESLRGNALRLLVIHDKQDGVVPFECGKRVYDLAGGSKDIWILEQGHHIGAFSPRNTEIRKRFLDFLEALSGASEPGAGSADYYLRSVPERSGRNSLIPSSLKSPNLKDRNTTNARPLMLASGT